MSGYEDGVLNVTILEFTNLPKKFKNQDDELVDQDAFVLIGNKTRVYGGDGERIKDPDEAGLDEYDGDVRVHGKLLPVKKWSEDEDGTPTTTIRAKKVFLLD